MIGDGLNNEEVLDKINIGKGILKKLYVFSLARYALLADKK